MSKLVVVAGLIAAWFALAGELPSRAHAVARAGLRGSAWRPSHEGAIRDRQRAQEDERCALGALAAAIVAVAAASAQRIRSWGPALREEIAVAAGAAVPLVLLLYLVARFVAIG